MKHIEKKISTEAQTALNTFKELQNSIPLTPRYSDFRDKPLLHQSLLEEQGYICAYCMQRIDHKGKIEHWKGQAKSRTPETLDLELDYNNMLAVCTGEAPEHQGFHCDTMRSQYQSRNKGDLTLNPTNEIHVENLKYLSNGTIYYDNPSLAAQTEKELSDIDKELQKYLNLNHLYLIDQRARAYDDAFQIIFNFIKQKKDKAFIQLAKQKLLKQWQMRYDDGFKPYCGIVLYFLQK